MMTSVTSLPQIVFTGANRHLTTRISGRGPIRTGGLHETPDPGPAGPAEPSIIIARRIEIAPVRSCCGSYAPPRSGDFPLVQMLSGWTRWATAEWTANRHTSERGRSSRTLRNGRSHPSSVPLSAGIDRGGGPQPTQNTRTPWTEVGRRACRLFIQSRPLRSPRRPPSPTWGGEAGNGRRFRPDGRRALLPL